MAKKATSKSRSGTKSGSKSTAVAERRSGERRSGERRSSDNGMGEVFIKLLQSPLVAEDQVERLRMRQGQCGAAPHLDSSAKLVGITADDCGSIRIAFDECCRRCATRQGLEAERSAASEQVGNTQIFEASQTACEHR